MYHPSAFSVLTLIFLVVLLGVIYEALDNHLCIAKARREWRAYKETPAYAAELATIVSASTAFQRKAERATERAERKARMAAERAEHAAAKPAKRKPAKRKVAAWTMPQK